MIRYQLPIRWMVYDKLALVDALTDAKAAVMSLKTIPFQRTWAEVLQQVQLKFEVAGTSRIEGADFTDKELDLAMSPTAHDLITRSQKQAHAAVQTYRWIAGLQDDRPIDANLIREVHRRIVTGADEDHCEPGEIRRKDQNVLFGLPQHRGVEGGKECEAAFNKLSEVIQREFKDHDLLIQSLALHYHFAAMHPFLDGNGRTARALEALVLQRAGLRDALFIAMSNYYYDEKKRYLETLGEVRSNEHDLTPFLAFGLKGIAMQCNRLFDVIRTNIAKEMFRNLMHDLFGRLRTPKKRVIAKRQMEILNLLLREGTIQWTELIRRADGVHKSLSNPLKALVRDVNYLRSLGAVHVWRMSEEPNATILIQINLEWPAQITEGDFVEITRKFPKAKPHSLVL
ncbi:MAG TPA: Fic family protein [Pyrinomonadaceae bacterium]|nr:Fic family protein [Pyrinomonadaceae bacterium]